MRASSPTPTTAMLTSLGITVEYVKGDVAARLAARRGKG
jgi:hypothetical protein